MKKKRYILYGLITFIVLLTIGIVTISVLSNKNKLTSEERTWINTNINDVQNIYVAKDANLFSKDGSGVFYSFLNDFSDEYGIKLNIVTAEADSISNGTSLNYTKTLNENDNIIYTDHYILISKNHEIIRENKDLENKVIGVLNSDLDYIKSYLKDNSINFNGYETEEELFKAVDGSVNYIILPRIKYIYSQQVFPSHCQE